MSRKETVLDEIFHCGVAVGTTCVKWIVINLVRSNKIHVACGLELILGDCCDWNQESGVNFFRVDGKQRREKWYLKLVLWRGRALAVNSGSVGDGNFETGLPEAPVLIEVIIYNRDFAYFIPRHTLVRMAFVSGFVSTKSSVKRTSFCGKQVSKSKDLCSVGKRRGRFK